MIKLTPEKYPINIEMMIFYMIYGAIGFFVYMKVKKVWKMGVISAVIGLLSEFILWKPRWIQIIYGGVSAPFETGSPVGEVAMAFVFCSLFWFSIWVIPSFVLKKVKAKNITKSK